MIVHSVLEFQQLKLSQNSLPHLSIFYLLISNLLSVNVQFQAQPGHSRKERLSTSNSQDPTGKQDFKVYFKLVEPGLLF